MNAEEHRPSLAEEAASWVPPWARDQAPPEAVPQPEPEAATDDAVTVEAVTVEAATDEAVTVEAADEEPPAPVSPSPQPTPAPDTSASDTSAPDTSAPDAPAPESAASGATLHAESLRGAIEAILLVVDEPTGEAVLAQALEQPTELVAATLAELAEEYARTGRGFELRRAAGGWRLYTRAEFAPYVERFVLDGQQVRLTQAALETLAVVAYKQPVTRSRISAIRGVNCDGVVRTLVSRGLIEECGTEPETGAYLYRTTSLFLERLGLDSAAELPPLAPFLPTDVDEIADAQR